jgi:hypothetical protein
MDETEEEKRAREVKENLDRWNERLEAGQPIMTFQIDEPLEVGVTPEGAMVLKFVFGQLGNFDKAAMAVAILSPAVARRLKATFPNIENIPDTPLPAPDKQSKN